MKEHEQYMQRAIELSVWNVQNNAGGPFGAVVVKDHAIIAEGYNCVTSSHDPTMHAEIMAIRHACQKINNFDLSGCQIYTSCEPCPMCLGAIYWAHVDAVYYANTRGDAAKIGFDDAFIYEEIGKDISDRKIMMRQLLRDDAILVFNMWMQKEDAISY